MALPKSAYAWKKAPFIRIVLPFILGIVLQDIFGLAMQQIGILFLLLILLILLPSFLPQAQQFINRWLYGVSIQLLIIVFGMAVMNIGNIKADRNWYGHQLSDSAVMVVKIEKPEEKAKTWKATAHVLYVNDKPAKGKLLLYFIKSDSTSLLKSGDVIWVVNQLQPVSSSGNPGSFDYAKYMAKQQVFHQAFLYPNQWKFLHINREGFFQKILRHTLQYEENVLNKYIQGPKEKALAKALLTGDRSSLDRELVQAYSNAGVVHLMAISGLHLGLIYILLLKITQLIPGLARKNALRMLVVLAGIWFFAFITGGSPSVLRAAVMFSFLCSGIMFNKTSSSFNALAASAFLLLCFDPMLIFHVGFQLSYAAVLGILILQRPIANWFKFENKLLVYVWQLVSVSIAAQLFTVPLCMYYFHQLPILFIISNLVAIPVASVGLWLGVLLISLGWLPLAAGILGKAEQHIFGFLNDFVQYIDTINFASWSGFYPNLLQVMLLYAIFIFALIWWLRKNTHAFKFALLSVFLFCLSIAWQKWESSNQQQLVVYNVSSSAAADMFLGNYFYPISETQPPPDEVLTARKIFFAKSFLRNVQKSAFEGSDIYSAPFRLLHLKKQTHFPILPQKIRLDYLLISNNSKTNMSDLSQTFDPGLIIFDGSNKRRQVQKWKKECEELHLRCHDIASQGAVVTNH